MPKPLGARCQDQRASREPPRGRRTLGVGPRNRAFDASPAVPLRLSLRAAASLRLCRHGSLRSVYHLDRTTRATRGNRLFRPEAWQPSPQRDPVRRHKRGRASVAPGQSTAPHPKCGGSSDGRGSCLRHRRAIVMPSPPSLRPAVHKSPAITWRVAAAAKAVGHTAARAPLHRLRTPKPWGRKPRQWQEIGSRESLRVAAHTSMPAE